MTEAPILIFLISSVFSAAAGLSVAAFSELTGAADSLSLEESALDSLPSLLEQAAKTETERTAINTRENIFFILNLQNNVILRFTFIAKTDYPHTDSLENLYEKYQKYNRDKHNTCLVTIITIVNGDRT